MEPSNIYPQLDLKATLSENRLVGLWRLMAGFRRLYLAAIISLIIGTGAKTLSYLLLRYFIDDALTTPPRNEPFPFM